MNNYQYYFGEFLLLLLLLYNGPQILFQNYYGPYITLSKLKLRALFYGRIGTV